MRREGRGRGRESNYGCGFDNNRARTSDANVELNDASSPSSIALHDRDEFHGDVQV